VQNRKRFFYPPTVHRSLPIAMCQTLFHIPLQISGLPVFGLGILFVGWAIFSAGLLLYLARRQGFNAETWGYVPILLLIAAIIGWMLPALCDEQGLPIHGYGVMMLLAVVAATGLAVWRAKRLGLHPDLIYSLALWMIIPGIIAARTFYVVEYWSTQYWPVYQMQGGWALFGAVINITQGGLVVYGGFVAGMAGLVAFAYRNQLAPLALADLLAPSMLLGLAIGRIGCLMNGCCYGGECHLPWAITFPAHSYAYYNQLERGQMQGFTLSNDPRAAPVLLAVDPNTPAGRAGLKPGDRLQKINGMTVSTAGEAYGYLWASAEKKEPLKIGTSGNMDVVLPAVELPPRSLPVHPTQIYSALDALIICLVLLASEPFFRRDGELTALMISIYAVTRFLIEMLRTDEAAVFGTGMTIAQNVSLVLLVLVAGFWLYLLRRPAGKAFYRTPMPQ
jgi:phosphatidylglycerol:prolipoprotein diacylglycerol transferase